MREGLPNDHGLPDFVMSSAELLPIHNSEPLLTDIQFDALAAGIATGGSVLVSAPTSTGKTLIGWWAIASTILDGGRAVYLVSHRALAKQKFEEAQRLFVRGPLGDDRTAIVCATGDGVEDASGRKTNAPLTATILIATYEKFLGCLSVGGPPRDLSDVCFVCDEVQLVGDLTRGKNVELLLTLMKRARWRQLVALSAVLSERDANSLSDWLEVRLVRNPTREKALKIECRSANNVHHISASPGTTGAMQVTNDVRETRTNRIVAELLRRPTGGPVICFCMKVDETYDLCNEWIASKNASVQVVPPAALELESGLRRALERKAAFHNAELSEAERLFVEERIASGDVEVIYSTSTLAAGVNFPLGSAVFASWTRYNFDRKRHEPIGRAEFQNMAGRVGRMGQVANEGLVVLSADGRAETQTACHLMDLSAQDELGTGIAPEDFGPLTLQLFAGKLCSSRGEAFEILASTLSAAREVERNRSGIAHWKAKLNGQIDRLTRAGCLIESRAGISVTAYGISIARSGLKPETANYFIEGLVRNAVALASMLPSADSLGREDDLLFVVAHAALTCPEFTVEGGKTSRQIHWKIDRNGAVPNSYAARLDGILWERPWTANPAAANGALVVASWAAGQSRTEIERLIRGVRLGTVEALTRDVAWILTGVSEVISDATSPALASESKPALLQGDSVEIAATRRLARALRRQAARIAAGLPSDVLWMTSLELRGRQRRLSRPQILSLRHQGLCRPYDLMDGTPDADQRRRAALSTGLDTSVANQVRDAARRWKVSEREYFRNVHVRRARKVDAEPVISSLYVSRGDNLEAAFEAAMALIVVACERLDRPGLQAHPDFLITIESFPPIVVEVKSKQAETDLVSLNAATEVLSASELIGLRGSFCLTLCSPGIEPNVPGVIESCARLCVVAVSDLVEAVLRIREGSLTRDGLYNWLTTPGIALMEDLPHPG